MAKGDTRTMEEKMERQETVNRWLELKISGMSYRAIAKQEGYASHGHIQQAVEKELAKVTLENREQLKKIMLEQVDEDYQRLESLAEQGDEKAIAARMRLRDQKAKLMGTFEPEKVQVEDTTPDHIKEMLRAAKREQQEESN